MVSERPHHRHHRLRVLLVLRPRRPVEHRGVLDQRAGAGLDRHQPRHPADHRPQPPVQRRRRVAQGPPTPRRGGPVRRLPTPSGAEIGRALAAPARRGKGPDEETPAVDLADARHAVEFRHLALRRRAHDLHVRQGGAESEGLDIGRPPGQFWKAFSPSGARLRVGTLWTGQLTPFL